jgi:hypothetical protein
MAKIDRNKLEVGQTVAWLNGGWAEGVIHTVVQGAQKVMYLVKPGYGLEEFGGASFTTGWKQSIIGADCIVALKVGGDSTELTPPNLDFAYGDSALFYKGELKKLPEVVPQDRNMYREWKEQKRADKVCVESPDEQDEREARERAAAGEVAKPAQRDQKGAQSALFDEPKPASRVRTRSRPTASNDPVAPPQPAPDAAPAVVARVRVRSRPT